MRIDNSLTIGGAPAKSEHRQHLMTIGFLSIAGAQAPSHSIKLRPGGAGNLTIIKSCIIWSVN